MLNKTLEGAAIVKRMLLKAKLELISPLIIGGGRSLYGDSDVIVLKDENGQPFIPSSSITGALKHAFDEYEYTGDASDYEENKRWFWGGEYHLKVDGECVKRSCQSAFVIADMMVPEGSRAAVTIRDGIKINRKTGIVETHKKFDFEIVEPGIAFDFKMEVLIRKAFDMELFRSFFNWITAILSGGEFAIGARTGQGFGCCKLEDLTAYEFDYRKPEHIIAWLSGDYSNVLLVYDPLQLPRAFHPRHKQFHIKAEFNIKNALIVGSYSGNPQAPDKVHIKSRNHNQSKDIAILPGTSLRGAIRSRAERIINTLGGNGLDELKGLFGWVDDKPGSPEHEEAIRGRIKIEEKQIAWESYYEEIQYRVKIDRFTGGAMNNALFDSMPLWSKDSKDSNETMVTLELSINEYKDWEAGLMLLILKDMWNGDLAVGGEKNVGRGVLRGLSASISLENAKIEIKQDGEQLMIYRQGDNPGWDEKMTEMLENRVAALIDHIEKNKGNRKRGDV
jgi:CRISPR/Cas system CSM-associated protein Csm3 (group 7 of RAMP superfamily)